MNNQTLAQTPENIKLTQKLEALNLEFLDLYTLHKQMVEDDSVILTALYLERIGRLQLLLLQKQTESSRLKMKIKLVQAAFNRSENPNLVEIEKIINERLEAYYKQIQTESQLLEESKKILSNLYSEEETLKLKEIFRVLCKRLHPDMNPHQSEEEKDLFIKVKAAYDLQRIADLQVILLYLDNANFKKAPELNVNEKQAQIEYLEKNIAVLTEKIELLKQEFPFSVEEFLNDEEQIALRQAAIEEQINGFEEEIEKSMNLLKLMLDE